MCPANLASILFTFNPYCLAYGLLGRGKMEGSCTNKPLVQDGGSAWLLEGDLLLEAGKWQPQLEMMQGYYWWVLAAPVPFLNYKGQQNS